MEECSVFRGISQSIFCFVGLSVLVLRDASEPLGTTAVEGDVERGRFRWRSGEVWPLAVPFGGDARDATGSFGSTLICREGLEGRVEADGERALGLPETKGILEDEERRPRRGPRVKASFAGIDIMRGTTNAYSEEGSSDDNEAGEEDEEEGGGREGESDRKGAPRVATLRRRPYPAVGTRRSRPQSTARGETDRMGW